MLLDTAFPRPPGDIGNPETFAGGALFETVHAATIGRVLTGDPRDPDLAARFLSARDRLVARGAGIITTSCGLLVFHQERLARDCPVPFTASSLFQVPLRQAQHGQVGILGLLGGSITPAHLAAAGIGGAVPVGALADDAHLLAVLRANSPEVAIDPARATQDVIAAGQMLRARAPGLDAIVLECTNLPPYQQALSEALDLPVYGFLDWLQALNDGRARPDGGLTAQSVTGIAR
ncbi:MAG: aspartate/glutamate racemase family protein [Rhodobacter sp.]|nr:hypothetical protein [Paracoccaceae bacterium]MCC0076892.1 aspartate/glutamate racemase family protein [Rhodobacter sp.]